MIIEPTKKPIYALPSTEHCNLCSEPFIDKFYDAKASFGSWAFMCPLCFREHEAHLGIGRGQEYTKQDDGQWLQTAGGSGGEPR